MLHHLKTWKKKKRKKKPLEENLCMTPFETNITRIEHTHTNTAQAIHMYISKMKAEYKMKEQSNHLMYINLAHRYKTKHQKQIRW